MALTTTTLSAAVAAGDTSINVTSATGFAAGSLILVDREFMQVAQHYVSGTAVPVLRGRDGSVQGAHASGANATVGTAADFDAPPAGVADAVTNPAQPAMPVYSYSAAGAITPVGGLHIINGTNALAMTLAAPAKDQDGQQLIVVGNGKAAHTLTVAGGLGAGGTGDDVGTFAAGAQNSVMLIAANGAWVSLPSLLGGTRTNTTVTFA